MEQTDMFVGVCLLLSLLSSPVFCHRMAYSPIHATSGSSEEYSNMWAVEVAGGRTVADDVASRHGFTNKGPIGSIKDMYHFVLDSGNGVHMPDKTAALRAEPAIKYAEQQKYFKHAKKTRH